MRVRTIAEIVSRKNKNVLARTVTYIPMQLDPEQKQSGQNVCESYS